MQKAEMLKRLVLLKQAARHLRTVDTDTKNRVLKQASRRLVEQQERILEANALDLASARKKPLQSAGHQAAFIDRLTLTAPRIEQMAESLRQVAALVDPVGEVVERFQLENGLQIRKVRSPLGVILMIFESRPNVAVEAFSLAFKSGNVTLLKAGSDSLQTVKILYEILEEACVSEGLPSHTFWGVVGGDRNDVSYLLKQKKWIDVVVPRGGDQLIQYVSKTSEIPIIKNDRGLCHIYVDEDADLEMATRIVINAKTQRPGVCNSMETLLVHQKIAKKFLPAVYQRLDSFPVEFVVCPRAKQILKKYPVARASVKSWNTEYLDLIMNCKVVDSLSDAILHIERYGSRHSESIITSSEMKAQLFQSEVDAAVVYHNASTRFTDGFCLGLGGELGISTQKLHVRGPVGLRELTSVRWLIEGQGQVR